MTDALNLRGSKTEDRMSIPPKPFVKHKAQYLLGNGIWILLGTRRLHKKFSGLAHELTCTVTFEAYFRGKYNAMYNRQ